MMYQNWRQNLFLSAKCQAKKTVVGEKNADVFESVITQFQRKAPYRM